MTGRVRPYRATDEGFVVSSWLKSFAASLHGKRWGASSSWNLGCSDSYWDGHRSIVLRLLREATVSVMADPEDDDIIWAWVCTDGPGVVHYALVKNSFKADGVGAELLRHLLGDRLEREQTITHEQCGMRAAGLRTPPQWKLDEYWMGKRWAA